MGWIYVLLSVFCSVSIAHFLKVADHKKLRILNVLSVNYLVAVVISLFLSDGESFVSSPISATIIFASIIGAIFILNFVIYGRSIASNGMGISVAAMRLSLLIPILLSIVYYHESVGWIQISGIGLVFVSMYFLLPKMPSTFKNFDVTLILPLVLFLFSGIADASLKYYEQELQNNLTEYGFLTYVFLSAFVISISILTIKKSLNFKLKEILYGIIIGTVNLYSSFFLILALKNLNGALVFPVTNIGNIMIGSLIGILIWKDRLSLKQKYGLGLAIVSILLLVS